MNRVIWYELFYIFALYVFIYITNRSTHRQKLKEKSMADDNKQITVYHRQPGCGYPSGKNN